MASVSGFPSPTQFSDCSRSDLQNGFTSRDLDRCLFNEPSVTVGDPVCGNGIRERDEICDCGSPSVSYSSNNDRTCVKYSQLEFHSRFHHGNEAGQKKL